MNNYLSTLLITFTLIVCPTASMALNYSPYADLTLNTHWDADYQDMEPADLVAVSEQSGIKNYHLAFITDSGNCQAAWGGQAAYSIQKAWGKHLTDNMRAHHLQYIVSFGGASGFDISLKCSESQLLAIYEQVLATYQPEGLDFDIENGTATISNIMRALTSLQNKYPTIALSFTLPVMPEGLTTLGENIIKQAQTAGLHFTVNIMTMDYGDAYRGDMGDYAISAATQVFNFLQALYPQLSSAEIWKKIEITPMIGVNDVTVEQFTLANVDTLRHFATEKQLHGLAMWSIARDHPCSDKWTSPICSGNNLQTVPYEFSKRFLAAQ